MYVITHRYMVAYRYIHTHIHSRYPRKTFEGSLRAPYNHDSNHQTPFRNPPPPARTDNSLLKRVGYPKNEGDSLKKGLGVRVA